LGSEINTKTQVLFLSSPENQAHFGQNFQLVKKSEIEVSPPTYFPPAIPHPPPPDQIGDMDLLEPIFPPQDRIFLRRRNKKLMQSNVVFKFKNYCEKKQRS
jgi:hypothetical protein